MNRQQHLLIIMAEECSEIAQRVTKALRFGLTEVQPGQNLNNTERIIYEINDLFAIIDMLREEGAFADNQVLNFDTIEAKKVKVKKYMKYAQKTGALEN